MKVHCLNQSTMTAACVLTTYTVSLTNMMLLAKNYNNMFEFVNVMNKILLFSFFLGHGVYACK